MAVKKEEYKDVNLECFYQLPSKYHEHATAKLSSLVTRNNTTPDNFSGMNGSMEPTDSIFFSFIPFLFFKDFFILVA